MPDHVATMSGRRETQEIKELGGHFKLDFATATTTMVLWKRAGKD
jgi:hypothetical protein